MKLVAKQANKSGTSSLLLRSGLAVVFIYAAVSSLITPEDWAIYLPRLAIEIADADLLLRIFAIYELVLAGLLISGRYVKWAGSLSALTFFGIIIANPSLFSITFRDIALIFASLALVFLED
jgi:hypothetical protein